MDQKITIVVPAGSAVTVTVEPAVETDPRLTLSQLRRMTPDEMKIYGIGRPATEDWSSLGFDPFTRKAATVKES